MPSGVLHVGGGFFFFLSFLSFWLEVASVGHGCGCLGSGLASAGVVGLEVPGCAWLLPAFVFGAAVGLAVSVDVEAFPVESAGFEAGPGVGAEPGVTISTAAPLLEPLADPLEPLAEESAPFPFEPVDGVFPLPVVIPPFKLNPEDFTSVSRSASASGGFRFGEPLCAAVDISGRVSIAPIAMCTGLKPW